MKTQPPAGEKITISSGRLSVPDNPVIPFIEGDGTGPDIWRASQLVFDAAVEKAYGGKRRIAWFEVLAGEKSPTQLRDAARALADVLPNARHRTLEGQSHNVSMGALAPVLEEFYADQVLHSNTEQLHAPAARDQLPEPALDQR